jgi:transcriptional regulator with XRE-family HTH domain
VSKTSSKRNISGRRIAEARAVAKPPLTQDDLSAKLALAGVQMDRAAVAKIENNLRRILDFELRAIARILDVKVDWLLGGED